MIFRWSRRSKRTTVVTPIRVALFGALLGVVADQGVVTHWKVFFRLSFPGSYLANSIQGYALHPSLETGALNAMFYALVGFLAGTIWCKRHVPLNWARSRKRSQPGHCSNCDYDLTGNVSRVCPECGTHVCDGLRDVASSDVSDGNSSTDAPECSTSD